MATTVFHLSVGRITDIPVSVPPLPEQRKIARILTTVDNLIEKTEALIAKYQSVKQGLMHDLFTRGVDEHGHLRPPYAEAPDLYKESELGWIPREWDFRPLGQLSEVGGGVTLGRDLAGSQVVELPYLRVANVQDGFLDLSEIKTVAVLKSEVPRFLLQPGDMLMTEGGDFDKLGRGTVWRGQISPCLHQNHIFRVRPNTALIVSDFLAAVTASSYGKRYFLVSSKQTTNLATINSTQLKAFPVPLPDVEEQSRIISPLRAFERRLQNQQEYLAKLRTTKTALMQDLLTGKVRVKVNESGAM
jgi:type I restriction enzyme S subunit